MFPFFHFYVRYYKHFEGLSFLFFNCLRISLCVWGETCHNLKTSTRYVDDRISFLYILVHVCVVPGSTARHRHSTNEEEVVVAEENTQKKEGFELLSRLSFVA